MLLEMVVVPVVVKLAGLVVVKVVDLLMLTRIPKCYSALLI